MTSKLTIEQAKRLRNDFECWQQDYDPKDDKEQYDMFGRGMVAMDMLIAGMYQEPVAYTDERNLGYIDRGRETAYLWGKQNSEASDVALYRHAQPEPVVSAELLHTAASAIEDLLTTNDRTGACVWFDLPFRLRSAANAQPAPEYPEVLPCSVLLEPGLRFGKGIKTSTMLAALARRAVHESDMAALSLEERVEFQARIEDFKALIAQPAPVVPDKMTAIVKDEAEYVEGWNACRAAMLAADPQLPGSDPATVPGKWIPVSEQMPPSRHEVLVGCWWGEKPRWCCKWATYIPCHPDAQSSGWLIPGASWTPTHWMELPAAPQEPKP
ncbi:DUF551 domain-containing protein [Klebsiella pneumoniae]|nr:DUF551 domain-containing protein [Klebsiella pneumoniae]MCY0519943.1 DUF551 domain-containing protein [Klebsiella pneumoniae]